MWDNGKNEGTIMRMLYWTLLICLAGVTWKIHLTSNEYLQQNACLVFEKGFLQTKNEKYQQKLLKMYSNNTDLKRQAKNIESEKEFDNKMGFGNATFYHDVGITRSGCPTRVGSLAVDPKVIPLGTRIRLIGFPQDINNWCIADDTGGMIKNNDVDIWIDNSTRCFDLGIIKTELNRKTDRFGDYIEIRYLYEINKRKY